jgi:hypothetical protein
MICLVDGFKIDPATKNKKNKIYKARAKNSSNRTVERTLGRAGGDTING